MAEERELAKRKADEAEYADELVDDVPRETHGADENEVLYGPLLFRILGISPRPRQRFLDPAWWWVAPVAGLVIAAAWHYLR